MHKTLSFWIALVMLNLGLLISNGVLGGGQLAQVGGWLLTILTALGYRALAPTTTSDPNVPTG